MQSSFETTISALNESFPAATLSPLVGIGVAILARVSSVSLANNFIYNSKGNIK